MSKIFYDHLVVLEEVDVEINSISTTSEEKEELWHLVDNIVQHRVMIKILDHLPIEHHQDFLVSFHDAPHNDSHINFLKDRINGDIEQIIKEEAKVLEKEILKEIKSIKKK